VSNDDQDAEIRMDRIRVRGGIGAAIVIVVLVGAMALDLPGLRIPAWRDSGRRDRWSRSDRMASTEVELTQQQISFARTAAHVS